MNFHETWGKNRAWNMGGPIQCFGAAKELFLTGCFCFIIARLNIIQPLS